MSEKYINKMDRRSFILGTSALCLSLAIPLPALARDFFKKSRKLSVGLITDLHQDVMHDGVSRMQAFVDAMKKLKPDAMMQLGDFAYPNIKNKEVIDLFNASHDTSLHVIGNHDTDSGHTHEQCVSIWGMPAPYYTQVVNGYRFIVLNGNDKGSPTHKGGYPSYINPQQAEWFKAQLAESKEPVIVVCHQPLAGADAINNATEIQSIISAARNKVLLIINGHTHIDYLEHVDGVPYLTINSASYFWMGKPYIHDSYTKEIHEKYPWIAYTCPYKDALFTRLAIDPKTETITIDGKMSEWVGPSPTALNYRPYYEPFQADKEIVPYIRPQKLSVKGRVISL